MTTTSVEGTLRQRLAEHAGQIILVVARGYVFHGCTGFGHDPRPEERTLDTGLGLGLIAEPFLRVEPDGLIEFYTKNERSWSLGRYEKAWEQFGGNITVVFQTLDDLGRIIYAPDSRREHEQKQLEAMGWTDPDFALEVIVGNVEVEKYLADRTLRELQEPGISYPHSDEACAAFEREKRRRVFPPGVLEQALELAGIATQRRKEQRELLERQRYKLNQVVRTELCRMIDLGGGQACDLSPELQYAYLTAFGVCVPPAIEAGAHHLEPYVVSAQDDLEVHVRPAEFLPRIAIREGIPFPEE